MPKNKSEKSKKEVSKHQTQGLHAGHFCISMLYPKLQYFLVFLHLASQWHYSFTTPLFRQHLFKCRILGHFITGPAETNGPSAGIVPLMLNFQICFQLQSDCTFCIEVSFCISSPYGLKRLFASLTATKPRGLN